MLPIQLFEMSADSPQAPHLPAPPAPAAPRAAGARTDAARLFNVCPDAVCGMTSTTASQLGHHTREQCLGRANSGAVLRAGRYKLLCLQRGQEFDSSHALGIHRRLKHYRSHAAFFSA